MAKRSKDGQNVKITQQHVDVQSLKGVNDGKVLADDIIQSEQWVNKLEQRQSDLQVIGMSDLDVQRDIAFKILYFFGVFVLFSISLLIALIYLLRNEDSKQHQTGVKHADPIRRTAPFQSGQSPIFNLASKSYDLLDGGAKKLKSKVNSS